MRIVIDLQGAQTTGSRFRGIGRYSLALAQAMARQVCEHDIWIALNGLFPDTIEPLRAAFDGLIPQERIVVWQLYWINGSITSSDYVAKAYSAFHRLIGRGDDAAVILLFASQDNTAGAQGVLESFAQTNLAAIDALLAKTRGRP